MANAHGVQVGHPLEYLATHVDGDVARQRALAVLSASLIASSPKKRGASDFDKTASLLHHDCSLALGVAAALQDEASQVDAQSIDCSRGLL